MNKIILFAIISIIAVSCSTPKERAKGSSDNGMFEDVPVSFETNDSSLLHLAVAIKADNNLVIGARGGFMPNTYYTTLTELIDPSSDDYRKRKPNVQYVAIHKESEEDPGKIIWALYNDSSKAYLIDSSGAFIARPGEGRGGAKPSDSLKAIRDKDFPDAKIEPLSAFNVIAKDLATVRTRLAEFPDKDWIVLILENGLNRKLLYELHPLMQAIKSVGFKHIQVGRNLGNLDTAKSVIGTYRLYDFEEKELQGFYEELYRPLNLKMPKIQAPNP